MNRKLSTLLTTVLTLVASSKAEEPLKLHSDNPHYFFFRGKPEVLITSGEHYGAVLNPEFDFRKYFDALAADGLNLTRIFPGCYVEPQGAFNIENNTLAPAAGKLLCPWARSGEAGYVHGGNKFDLTKWDETFFARLRDCVEAAGKKGIVVEMNLFTPMYEDPQWNYSPMQASNNVNGIGKVGKHEVYTIDKEPALLKLQEDMTRKVVRELNGFDNLYYEVMNEPYFGGVTREWHDRITDVIVATEKDLPNQHLISWNVANDTAKVENPHPGISIFNFHYAQTSAVTDNFALNKPLGMNETGFKGTGDEYYRIQAWEFMLSGGALYNHLDYSFCVGHEDGTFPVKDPTPGGGGMGFRKQMRSLGEFLRKYEFWKLQPDRSFVKGELAKGGGFTSMAESGKQYAVYFKGGGGPSLELELPKGNYSGEWLDAVSGSKKPLAPINHPGGAISLNAPGFPKDFALRLVSDKK